MTAKDLKNALLQEAVQGKLVPQIASEGNARDLLEEIRKEKLSHGLDFANAKSGKKKSKKETALAGSNPCDIKEDEIPFDIPENWCWCRLGEICSSFSTGPFGTMLHKDDYVDSNGIPLINPANINDNSIDVNGIKLVSKEKYKTLQPYVLHTGDIVLARRGDLSKCAIVEIAHDGWLAGTGAFFVHLVSIDNKFFQLLYKSKIVQNYLIADSVGTTMDNLNQTLLSKLPIPLPPLAEQKRIVAAIEKFMPLIEEYGKKETELNAFNEQIGTLTKKAILQEAVQGKLVPQISAEGIAKDLLEDIKKEKAKLIKEGKIKNEKPLPEITEDEIPFDIPENWCWCRLGEIVNKLTDGTHRTPKYVEKGIPFLSVKNLSSGKMDFENTKFITPEEHKELYARCNPEKGDMLLTKVGTTGIPVINDSDIDCNGKPPAKPVRLEKFRPLRQ